MEEQEDRKSLQQEAKFYVALIVANALAVAFITALSNVEFDQLSATKKFVLCWSIIQNLAGHLLAFMNTTMARLRKGKPPFPTGTEQITREQAGLPPLEKKTDVANGPVPGA